MRGISYKRAKSLGDILVRVKLEGHVSHYHKLISRVHLPPRNRPHVGIWTASHVSMCLVLVSDSFIPKGPWELLWLVQAHRPVFGSVKLAPIKYEKNFRTFWLGCAAGTLEPLACTRASTWILLHKTRLNSPNTPLSESSCFPETTDVTSTVQPKTKPIWFFYILEWQFLVFLV